ncbi:isochorismatase family protein [Neisseria chenwenguii]|uniref:Isochorismatase n=1 Tax=Neisseria chenwenguii TaxID=1853278 RepID=A0A220S091_9NEIS|nr:isochorismatase family protein [Neisseria chenwenguii]ASK26874.1 isochorismatase [Neisseria chenwenguii]ROV56851.1 isochorismatase family protein [Neisseria chenwenguii]
MKPSNTLCLVVDIQERLLPALADAAEMVGRSRTVIQGLQALDVPLAVTEQYPKGLGKTVPAIARLLEDAPVFEKTQFSALTPEVEALLAEKNIRYVVLIGAEAHVCMLQTALDLREKGFNVYIPSDCTASRDPANKENGLQQMRYAGAVVGNSESVLFQLLRDAKHPAFKTVSKLIR